MSKKNARKLIGLTGPSMFTSECIEAIEDEKCLDANFVLLYHNKDVNLEHWLKEVDAVMLAGGVDIHPSIYEEDVWTNCNLTKFDIKRDCRELLIINHCVKNNKPMLGICRGHQILGVHFGLTVVMDLANSSVCHQPQRHGIQATKNEYMHSIRLLDPDYVHESFDYKDNKDRKVCKEIMGQDVRSRLWVNSFHHQALAYSKDWDYARNSRIRVLGTSRVDLQNCKEIIEMMEGKNWISAQFHPEYDYKENPASFAVLSKFKKIIDQEK